MIVLVLGGARSGKSTHAERLAAGLDQPVTYLATAAVTDPDFAARVEHHRARRPKGWSTVETGAGLAAAVRDTRGTVLIDSLGTWVAQLPGFAVDEAELCAALTGRSGDTVVVSEEVGMGVHPATEAGRQFRDALGALNQAVAAIADRALLVVAGRPLLLGEG